MEKAEPAVVAATPATGGDMPPKKLALARQLDFTPVFGHSAAALPAERQTQPLQTHQSSPLLHPVSQSQTCLLPQAVATAAVQRPAHPVSRLALSTASVVMLESPRPQRQAKLEGKDGTPKKPKQCNCKNSKCLKLYCECFATGVYCDGCNCTNCHNNLEHEAARQEAIGATLERNPNAFRPKINSSPHGTRHGREQAGQPSLVGKHNKGCNCKKSGCLKKYCECFQANIMCSDNCKCVDCKNKEGSEERQALLYGSNYNTMIFAQQAANAAISGAIGSSGYGTSPASKKRKSREILFGTAVNYHSFYHAPHPVQEKLEKSTQPASMLPDAISRDTKAVAGSSRIMYRSPLTNVIQPHDVKDLCSLLVVLSEKAKKALTATDTGGDMAGIKSSADNASKVRVSVEQDPESQTAAPSNNTMEELADTTNCSGSHGSDMHSKDRPASPGTLALMCDEEDTVLSEGEASNQGHICAPRLPNGQNCTELYAEQEKLVLTKFRDYLNRLITCGSIKETMAKEGNKAQEGTKSNTVMGDNGTTSRTKNGVHLPNSVMKPRIPVTNQDSQRVPKTKPASNNGLQPKAEFFIQNDILKPKAEGAL